jgi:hypothetical protein
MFSALVADRGARSTMYINIQVGILLDVVSHMEFDLANFQGPVLTFN